MSAHYRFQSKYVAPTARHTLYASAHSAFFAAKPIRLVVGFAPGGAADFVARALGEFMVRVLGQSIVIENRAGAGSSIAAGNVAKSAPAG